MEFLPNSSGTTMKCLADPNHRLVNEVTIMHLITVKEAMRRLSLGRGTIYKLMNEGILVSVKVGRSRRIRVDSVDQVGQGDVA